MTLGDAKVGSTVVVTKIEGDESAYKRRIMDMGITKEANCISEKLLRLGNPVEITVRGYELSVRKERCSVRTGKVSTLQCSVRTIMKNATVEKNAVTIRGIKEVRKNGN